MKIIVHYQLKLQEKNFIDEVEDGIYLEYLLFKTDKFRRNILYFK